MNTRPRRPAIRAFGFDCFEISDKSESPHHLRRAVRSRAPIAPQFVSLDRDLGQAPPTWHGVLHPRQGGSGVRSPRATHRAPTTWYGWFHYANAPTQWASASRPNDRRLDTVANGRSAAVAVCSKADAWSIRQPARRSCSSRQHPAAAAWVCHRRARLFRTDHSASRPVFPGRPRHGHRRGSHR